MHIVVDAALVYIPIAIELPYLVACNPALGSSAHEGVEHLSAEGYHILE